LTPSDADSHDIAHKFPFVATDILTSSKSISQALIEGGVSPKIDEGDESGEDKKSEQDTEDNTVQKSINETNVSLKSKINYYS